MDSTSMSVHGGDKVISFALLGDLTAVNLLTGLEDCLPCGNKQSDENCPTKHGWSIC